jgi:hypothetical protein
MLNSAGQIIISPHVDNAWKPTVGISIEDYLQNILMTLTMEQLVSLSGRPITFEPGFEQYAKIVDFARSIPFTPADLYMRVGLAIGAMSPTPEVDWYVQLRLQETSPIHAFAFDQLIRSGKCSGVDLMWTFSYFESSKIIAKRAMNEVRGMLEKVGEGLPCEKCGQKLATMRPLQVNAGDEPTKFIIECLSGSCRFSRIIG